MLVVDLKITTLGSDFLKHFELLPNFAQWHLMDSGLPRVDQLSIHLLTQDEHLNNHVSTLFEQYPSDLQKPPKY